MSQRSRAQIERAEGTRLASHVYVTWQEGEGMRFGRAHARVRAILADKGHRLRTATPAADDELPSIGMT